MLAFVILRYGWINFDTFNRTIVELKRVILDMLSKSDKECLLLLIEPLWN